MSTKNYRATFMLCRFIFVSFLSLTSACWYKHPLMGIQMSEKQDFTGNLLTLTLVTANNNDSGTMILGGSTTGITYQGGGSHSVQLSLSKEPSSEVTVTTTCSATCEGSISPTSLTFTSTNYNTPQTITVTGTDDAIFDIADTTYTVTLTSSAGGNIIMNLTSVGDRRIFQTATTSFANLGGISGADSTCMSDANKPAGSSTYKVMLTATSTRVACISAYCLTGGTTEHTDWVFLPNTNYYRRDGSLIVLTTNANGILSSGVNLTNQIWTSGFSRIFSGVNANWTIHGARCSNWTYGGSGGGGVHWGNTSNTTSQFWSFSNDGNCNQFPYPIICVEQ